MDVSQLYYDAFRCIQRAVAPSAQSFKDAAAIAQDRHSGMRGWTGYCRKLGGYLSYKAACFKAYMLGYHALDRMQATQGGEAVRLTQEADKIVRTAAILGREYDNLKPQTAENERHVFALHLRERMSRIEAQCQKDNIVVYMQKVPDALPALPKPKQLVSAVDYTFPALDTSVDRSLFSSFDLTRSPDYDHIIDIDTAGKLEATGQGKAQTTWWRWLLAVIAIPTLLFVSTLGVIVWIFLFPLKVFCFPVGCAAQLLWAVTEWVIKAPALFMLWAAGKPWKPQKRDPGKTESGTTLISGHLPSL